MKSRSFAHHFSENNIPFGIASSERHVDPRPVTRLGNTVFFLENLAKTGFFDGITGLSHEALQQSTLNQIAALPRSVLRSVRQRIQDEFKMNGLASVPDEAKEDIEDVTLHLPVAIGDFSDFSCSLEHVKNAGRIIINDERPPPGFFNFPIGYQGRASSIVVSGTDIERPLGQFRNPDASSPGAEPIIYGPSRKMDYELELAAIVGRPLPMRQRLRATRADDHIFGFALLNDWSARDIQGFEMTPLGPFNGKSVGTTLSPWIVTLDALEPFRVTGPAQKLPLPAYLEDPARVTYAIRMQAEIDAAGSTTVLGASRVQSLYWTTRQMVAHAVSSGSALRTGDVLATGTVSGPEEGALGCLLEVTRGGAEPVRLEGGEERAFLEDGDVVRLTATAGDEGSGVGFGECTGRVVASRPYEEGDDACPECGRAG
ncbi:fumarylacetoacetase [Plectosphaerella cucumerina]|uniref:Fumarylacetoacetase n=1 Tax=Plectosphaerella cucumerina TaxID=40658 RepID=A0A8K0TNS3_9PEZI|nr:fumarylacetoacetase [Plectosphaerella cucumerina]